MFAYCRNSPNNYADHDGYLPVSFEYYIVDRPDTVVDLTDVLNTLMRKNAQELAKYHDEHSYRDAALYFYNNVKDGGAWDIKLLDEWKFEDGVRYKYNGRVLRSDDPGNINFGYVGAVLFSEWILCFGAGVNQISKWGFQYGDITTFYDDPQDNEMIKYGYNLYWEDQK